MQELRDQLFETILTEKVVKINGYCSKMFSNYSIMEYKDDKGFTDDDYPLNDKTPVEIIGVFEENKYGFHYIKFFPKNFKVLEIPSVE